MRLLKVSLRPGDLLVHVCDGKIGSSWFVLSIALRRDFNGTTNVCEALHRNLLTGGTRIVKFDDAIGSEDPYHVFECEKGN